MAPKPTNAAASKYEIAQPQTYSAFPLTPAQPPAPAQHPAELREQTVAPRAPATPVKPASEDWSDLAKSRPKVPPSAKDLFEPPDEFRDKSIRAESITREKRAVWIVHGMGQQIPFETLDSLTNGLLDALRDQDVKPRLRNAKIGDQVLQRVKLDIDGQATGGAPAKNYELHLYESY